MTFLNWSWEVLNFFFNLRATTNPHFNSVWHCSPPFTCKKYSKNKIPPFPFFFFNNEKRYVKLETKSFCTVLETHIYQYRSKMKFTLKYSSNLKNSNFRQKINECLFVKLWRSRTCGQIICEKVLRLMVVHTTIYSCSIYDKP